MRCDVLVPAAGAGTDCGKGWVGSIVILLALCKENVQDVMEMTSVFVAVFTL